MYGVRHVSLFLPSIWYHLVWSVWYIVHLPRSTMARVFFILIPFSMECVIYYIYLPSVLMHSCSQPWLGDWHSSYSFIKLAEIKKIHKNFIKICILDMSKTISVIFFSQYGISGSKQVLNTIWKMNIK